MATPDVSVVIPVYNEEAVAALAVQPPLPRARRARPQLRADLRRRRQPRPSVRVLRGQFDRRPDVTRVVLLQRQLRPAHGDPGRLRARARRDRGHARRRPAEPAGGDRQAARQDGAKATTTSAAIRRSARTACSAASPRAPMNRMREHMTRIRMTDQGCMLRAYGRDVVDAINLSPRGATPSFRRSPTSSRAARPRSRWSTRSAPRATRSTRFTSLIRLNFDLITGFSVVPLQMLLAHRHDASRWARWSLFVLRSLASTLLLFGCRSALGHVLDRDVARVLPHRRRAVRHRPDGRVHRPHPAAGARPAALPDRRQCSRATDPAPSSGSRMTPSSSPTTTSASAACACCWRAASTCRWSSRIATIPARRIWFGSVADARARAGHRHRVLGRRSGRRGAARGMAALRPISFSRSTTAACCRRRCSRSARRGAFNMHGSLLPKYRGRAPVNWAVLQGETETGATLHEMVAKPDAGASSTRSAVPILPGRHRAAGVRQGDRRRRAGVVTQLCRAGRGHGAR